MAFQFCEPTLLDSQDCQDEHSSGGCNVIGPNHISCNLARGLH